MLITLPHLFSFYCLLTTGSLTRRQLGSRALHTLWAGWLLALSSCKTASQRWPVSSRELLVFWVIVINNPLDLSYNPPIATIIRHCSYQQGPVSVSLQRCRHDAHQRQDHVRHFEGSYRWCPDHPHRWVTFYRYVMCVMCRVVCLSAC